MKICFWGDVAGALKGKTPGGAELQISLLAKALALSGHEVVIVDPFASESFITVEGIHLLAVSGFNRGLRGVRLFLYRLPALWKIFVEQRADYYFITMRFYLHLIPYFAAKRTGAKLILAIASDLDLLGSRIKYKYSYKPRYSYWDYLTVRLPSDIAFNFILKKADILLLQHTGQILPPSGFRGEVVIFPNIINVSELSIAENSGKEYFIHVGTLCILKGLDKLYELILKTDKKEKFVIVGQARDNKAKKILAKLAHIENVEIKGRLNHDETVKLIANSRALISTSYYEGFPNIFVEAWATGVPVISLKVNPGDVINKYNLGICCEGDLQAMVESLKSFQVGDFDSNKLVSYVKEFHDFDTASSRFSNIIKIAN
jgi:glycosyltransferase involved in cell wall biosynthesis